MSQPKVVRIQVTRDDGDSILMDGVAGLAVVLQTDDVPVLDDATPEEVMKALPDMPLISMRATNRRQLALMLAGLIGTIRDTAGEECVAMAFGLAEYINASEPEYQRTLPDRKPFRG